MCVGIYKSHEKRGEGVLYKNVKKFFFIIIYTLYKYISIIYVLYVETPSPSYWKFKCIYVAM